ncbi:MAG: sulfatase [Holophagales bacterium]|nr:sulfatase [Holophagales bacterium]
MSARRPLASLPALAAFAAFAVLAAGATGCAPRPGKGPKLAPTRGIVLISLDTLRADRLGAYGYGRPTSPFLDSLAERAALFERHYVQAPATLPSHMSIFTGLWPREHGVVPPAHVLSSEIPTLPEVLRRHGFRNGAFTEGGWMGTGFGFERGFELYVPHEYAADTDIAATFDRGLDFLRRLEPGERFFLFLHTYSIHDPYDPPEPFRAELAPRPLPAGAPPPDGEHLAAFNERPAPLPEGTLAVYGDLYDASIRYVDSELERLFEELERMGLAGETTIVLTSDHGEEFLEHGRLVHTQVYPECLHVPLLLVHPQLRTGIRVPALTRSIDLAATLWELAGVDDAPETSGTSLLPLLVAPEPKVAQESYAETEILWGSMRTLLRRERGSFEQVVRHERHLVPTGFWVDKSIAFDAMAPTLAFEALSYHEPRRVTVTVDGTPLDPIDIPTDWTRYELALPAAAGTKVDVRFETQSCTSPKALGLSDDVRCLSFKLKGIPVDELELFDLEADPLGATDLSATRLPHARTLAARLDAYRHTPKAEATTRDLTEEEKAQLRALGYLR